MKGYSSIGVKAATLKDLNKLRKEAGKNRSRELGGSVKIEQDEFLRMLMVAWRTIPGTVAAPLQVAPNE